MKKNHNVIATSALIKKSKGLYKAKKISKLEHKKNMNYILQNMDALFVNQKQCDMILDILFVQNNNNITLIMDQLISSLS